MKVNSMAEKTKQFVNSRRNIGKGFDSVINMPDGADRIDLSEKMKLDIIPYMVKTKRNPVAKKGETWWERTYAVHNDVGIEGKKFVCLKETYGKPCYICEIQKNLTCHIARHTFATTITLTNGVPIETVSKMLGHKNLQTTQIYSKVIDKKISEDMENLRKKLAV